MKIATDKRYEAIQAIFSGIEGYREDKKRARVSFSIRAGYLTFDNLQKLSILLDTKMINVEAEYDGCTLDHGDGRCYCDGGRYIELTCDDVKL